MHRALFNAGAADMVSCCQLIFGWKSEETLENLVPTRMHETHCEILEILHVYGCPKNMRSEPFFPVRTGNLAKKCE